MRPQSFWASAVEASLVECKALVLSVFRNTLLLQRSLHDTAFSECKACSFRWCWFTTLKSLQNLHSTKIPRSTCFARLQWSQTHFSELSETICRDDEFARRQKIRMQTMPRISEMTQLWLMLKKPETTLRNISETSRPDKKQKQKDTKLSEKRKLWNTSHLTELFSVTHSWKTKVENPFACLMETQGQCFSLLNNGNDAERGDWHEAIGNMHCKPISSSICPRRDGALQMRWIFSIRSLPVPRLQKRLLTASRTCKVRTLQAHVWK